MTPLGCVSKTNRSYPHHNCNTLCRTQQAIYSVGAVLVQ